MNVEEFASTELVEKIRSNLLICLENIGVPDGFRRDRLLTNLTREIALSFM